MVNTVRNSAAIRHPNTVQDGYAVRAADGAGEYVVGFDALAGSAPGLLKEGLVAYIGTGTGNMF